MKAANYGTLGSPPAFLVSESASDYWLMRYCYEQSLTMYNLSQQGIQIIQQEAADISAIETDFDALSTELQTWIGSAVDASAAGEAIPAFDASYIPEIAAFIVFAATGQWGAVFALFCKVGLNFLIESRKKDLDPQTATGDVAEVLKSVLGVINENGDIVGSKVDGLTNLNINVEVDKDSVESYSIS